MAVDTSNTTVLVKGVAVTSVLALVVLGGALIGWLPLLPKQATGVATEAGMLVALYYAVQAHREPGTAKEPLAIAGALLAAITPLVPLAAAFYPEAFDAKPPDGDTTDLVEALVEAVGTVIVALFARRFVTPGNTPAASAAGTGA